MAQCLGIGALEVPSLGLLLDGQPSLPVEGDHGVPVGVHVASADRDAQYHQTADLVALVGREGPECGGAAEVDVHRLEGVVDILEAGVHGVQEPVAFGHAGRGDEVDLAEDLFGAVDAGASGADLAVLLQSVDDEGCV